MLLLAKSETMDENRKDIIEINYIIVSMAALNQPYKWLVLTLCRN